MRLCVILVVGAAATLGGVLGARARELARIPPFEVDIVLHRRPRMRIDGLALGWIAGDRTLVLTADSAAAQSDRIGAIAVSPSRHLALRRVSVTCERGGARLFRASADRGELRSDVLALAGRVRVARGRDERERAAHTVRVHLASGRLTTE